MGNQIPHAERGSAQRLAWIFTQEPNSKPKLLALKHQPILQNHVRVKVAYFGIGSHNLVNKTNLQNGFEVVGVVEAIGSKVGSRKIGDLVGLGQIRESCKNCQLCWDGKQDLCKNVKCDCKSISKGFSTHVNVPADWTFPIPKNIPLSEAAPLLYSGVSAYNIVSGEYERLKLEHNRKLRLAIFGVGPIGHMAAKFANHFGYEVTIFGENIEEEKFLKENGVKFEQFLALNGDSIGKNGLKFDVVLAGGEVTKDVLKRAIELPRRNGKLVFLGQSLNELGISAFSLVIDQKEITGVRNGAKDDFYKMLELVAHVTSNNNKTLLPISEHFSVTEIEKALSRVESSKAKYQVIIKIEEDIVLKYNKNEF